MTNERRSLRAAAAPIAWTLFLALPIAGAPFVDGVPLGPFEACAIALVWWVWAAERRLPGTRRLIALTLVKLAVGMVLVPGGLAARYYANDSWSPPIERSVEFRRSYITRRDRELAFGGERQPDLPLHFFNDLRFNFFRATEPARARLAYSVVWEGWIEGDGRTRSFYLDAAEGTRGELSIDERPVVTLSGPSAAQSGSLPLDAGWHFVTVRVAAPYGAGRRVDAGEFIGGDRRPFGDGWVVAYPAGALRRTADMAARWVTGGINLIVLSWLAVLVIVGVRRAWVHRHVGRLLWLVVIADASLFALPYARRVMILGGGEDWLTYEHLARAIIGDPLLQRPGPGAGQGAPFYYQVLYPYFLAIVHFVSGDGLFGVVFAQRLLLGAAAGWTAMTTARLFGNATGGIALVIGGWLLYAKGGRWAEVLLGESLFTPLLTWWAWLLVQSATAPATRARLVLVGVVGGVATLVRSSLLAAVPLVVPVWAFSVGRGWRRALAIAAAAFLLVLSLVTIRTWIVTGTLAIVPASGATTFLIDNRRALQGLPPVRESETTRERPPGGPPPTAGPPADLSTDVVRTSTMLLRNAGRRALFTVGLFDYSGIRATGVEVPSASWLYVGIWCAAVAGTIRLLRGRAGPLTAAMALPGLIALSHFAVMLLFAPQIYGDRRILPLYPLLVPYAALGVVPIVERARRHVGLVGTIVLAALSGCVFLGGLPRSLDATLTLLVIGGAMLALSIDPPRRMTREGWLYGGYAAAALATYAAGRYFGGFEIDPASAFLFPLAVFAVARLARPPTAFQAAAVALFVGAVAAVALVRPAVPGFDEDVVALLSDVGQDVRGWVSGNPDAPRELAADTRELYSAISMPLTAAAADLVSVVGAISAWVLVAIWLRATAASGVVAARQRSMLAGLCCAALLLIGLLAIVGVAPAAWGASPYSLALVAVLVGLAESRIADRPGRNAAVLRTRSGQPV